MAHICMSAAQSACSKDVHTTLLQILVTHGNLTKEAAAETLIGMQREGRYARDVY